MTDAAESLVEFARVGSDEGNSLLIYFGPHAVAVKNARRETDSPGVLFCTDLNDGEFAIAEHAIIAVRMRDEEA